MMRRIRLSVTSLNIGINLILNLILVVNIVSSFLHDYLLHIFILFFYFLSCLMVNVVP
jgi:hypothetical protein